MSVRSIPPVTSTGSTRLRSADPVRFRTRPRKQAQATDDPYGAGMAPTSGFGRYDKPERPRPSTCGACGGTNIAGCEQKDGQFWVFCCACDGLRKAASC